MRTATILTITLLSTLALLIACTGGKQGFMTPPQHPPEAELGKQRPICTECHEARGEHIVFENFNHTTFFAEQHRRVAYQSSSLCNMCHAESFCSDCHASKSELKPSLRNQSDTYRRMPHRGDFLTRHRIEGKIDPTSCFRCHGNPRASQACAPCHG